MTDYKEVGKKSINGVKRVIYMKPGSSKQYLKHKGRMMNVVKYKKMMAKKAEPKMKPVKKSKKNGKKRGGDPEAASLTETFNTALKQIQLLSTKQ